jgi:hypothetical protein
MYGISLSSSALASLQRVAWPIGGERKQGATEAAMCNNYERRVACKAYCKVMQERERMPERQGPF